MTTVHDFESYLEDNYETDTGIKEADLRSYANSAGIQQPMAARVWNALMKTSDKYFGAVEYLRTTKADPWPVGDQRWKQAVRRFDNERSYRIGAHLWLGPDTISLNALRLAAEAKRLPVAGKKSEDFVQGFLAYAETADIDNYTQAMEAAMAELGIADVPLIDTASAH